MCYHCGKEDQIAWICPNNAKAKKEAQVYTNLKPQQIRVRKRTKSWGISPLKMKQVWCEKSVLWLTARAAWIFLSTRSIWRKSTRQRSPSSSHAMQGMSMSMKRAGLGTLKSFNTPKVLPTSYHWRPWQTNTMSHTIAKIEVEFSRCTPRKVW